MNTSTSLKKSPLKFFLLVFALSLPFWLLGAFVKHLPIPINLPISALQSVCPIIAAFILVSREESSGGIKKFLQRVFAVKSIQRKIWYVPTLLLSPLIMVLSYGVMRLLGRPLPEPSIPFLMIPVFFVVFFIGAVGEEGGWMGYIVDPMQDRWSALTTSIILGSVWAIWHAIPFLQAQPPIWVIAQCLSAIALRIIIVWLYNNTGKSVLAAILFHDTLNVSEFLFPNYGSHYDPIITGIITAIVAVIVTFLWGSKTLARYRYAHMSQSLGNFLE